MKRYYFIFKGQVQGVGFRFRVIQLAKKYRLSGYCKNLSNGSVEVQAQGENKELDDFLRDILNLQGFIQIDDYVQKELEITNEHDFVVKY